VGEGGILHRERRKKINKCSNKFSLFNPPPLPCFWNPRIDTALSIVTGNIILQGIICMTLPTLYEIM
jgi:hypothetical protein